MQPQKGNNTGVYSCLALPEAAEQKSEVFLFIFKICSAFCVDVPLMFVDNVQ